MIFKAKPREEFQGKKLLKTLKRFRLFDYQDSCTVIAVAKYIQNKNRTFQEAFKQVMSALKNKDLLHVSIGATELGSLSIAVTRWTWVQEWIEEQKIELT